MASFVTLYSGSSGNATLITDGGSSVLIDVGRSCRYTVTQLKKIGADPESIRAVLLTHEHSDHVGGLFHFLRRYKPPVFGAAATLTYLRAHYLVPEDARMIEIDGLSGVDVEEMAITAFRTPHDSEACVGYKIRFSDGATAAVATDLGRVTDEVAEALQGCDLIGLESNYDRYMLDNGPYPYSLKRRIRSENGHLSNDDCAKLAVETARKGTSRMILMHLSEENNTPEIALTSCLSRLEDSGLHSMQVTVAPRHEAGEPIEIAARFAPC